MTKTESKAKISKEVAAEQLFKLFDYYDLERDDIADKDQLAAFDGACSRLTKAIMKGRIEIQDNGIIVQHLKNPPGEVAIITYTEISGKAKMAMDGKGQNDSHGRIYALMGSLSGIGETGISALKGADLSLVECLGLVFMLV